MAGNDCVISLSLFHTFFLALNLRRNVEKIMRFAPTHCHSGRVSIRQKRPTKCQLSEEYDFQ